MPDEQIRIGLAIVSDAGTRKTLDELAKVRQRIAELKTEFQSGGKNVDQFTKELADLEKQAKTLDKALDSVGGKAEFDMGLGQFGPQLPPERQSAGAGLRGLGRGLRNLPSVQLPGLGVGTDAIGNLARVSGSIIDVGEKSKVATAAANLLTPALGAQAAATAAAFAPVALLTAGFVAIGLAIKSLVDSTSQNVDQINSFAENQRALNEKIAGGLTTDQAQEELDKLTEAQERNRGTLGQLQGAYDSSQQQLGVLGGLTKVFSGDEEALANQINETNTTIGEQQGKIDALKGALEDGSLAANDAAIAEKKLAEERTAAVLEAASAAGQEESARRKALEATTEQNEKRLQSIEDEKAAIEAQLGVLQSSGDTSEKVSDQIGKLTGQLSSLGKESDFINKTALAASKARDAEKKAQKDAEDAAKKTAAAQQKYTDATRNAGRTFTQASQDIGTKLKQGLDDNLTGLLRDATDIAEKYRRDNVDLDIKASRDERDAAIDHFRNLEDIRDNALKSELENSREGDFKQLFLSRQAAQDALRDEQKSDTREKQDRLRAISDQRNDLFTAQNRERSDRLTAFERQNADLRLTAQRDLQQQVLTHQRSLQMNQEAYNAELQQQRNFLDARYKQQVAADKAMLKSSTGATLPGTQLAGGSQLAQLAQVIR